MKKMSIPLIILVLLALLNVAANEGTHIFRATLSGAEEVPPVDTATTGEVKFKVDRMMTQIEFDLRLHDGVDLMAVAGAHIHCAPAGVNGPVVVFLAGAVPGGFDGEVRLRATVTEANIVNTACGATLAELVQSMQAGNTYVNVHTTANPGGEVRGQIEGH